jgi:hypothetical protein
MTGFRSLANLGGVWGRLRRAPAPAHDTSPAPESDIDTDWLERHVFFMAPEVVGAAYDRRVAGAEVAAVLARMCGELKLASRVATGARGWNNLELWLLAEREELAGYERELVDSLFITGKTTSADIIQREYQSGGFEPAAILRPHLSAAADAALGVRRRWPLGLRRESADGLALRRDLRGARRFFARELERPEPRLRDEWLPYLIALELSVQVERWFQAFGRIETAALEQRLAQQAESSGGAAQGWTGGAGALGGIGASGPWIAATAGLTVAAAREKRASAGKRAPHLQLEHA